MTVQNYYTRKQLAKHIASHFSHRLFPKTVLDLCAGIGNLSQYFNFGKVTFVEPDPKACAKLAQFFEDDASQIFAMTAEEFCLTYAEPEAFEAVFCNPPFGPRIGRTSLDELIKDLHLPELEQFESYFLAVASILAKTSMTFLLPESYFNQQESESIFQALAYAGWNLTDFAELPVDGYEGATVRTYLFHFKKMALVPNWPAALARLGKGLKVPTFHQYVKPTVFRANFRDISGYSLADGSEDETETRDFADEPNLPAMVSPPRILWQPTAQQLGSYWTRMGCVYELKETGWQPACGIGYLNGKIVSQAMDSARQAFELQQQGALRTAAHLLTTIDVKALQEAHHDLPDASFLTLLPKPSFNPQALEQDLAQLGIIRITATLQTHFDSKALVRQGPYLILPQAMKLHHKAELFIHGHLVGIAVNHLARDLEKVRIPLSQLELRSSWIPKSLIAKYLKVILDNKGNYIPSNFGHHHYRLIAYLNYCKAGVRLEESDPEYYELANNTFAMVMTNWQDMTHQNLRLRIYAHYILREKDHRHIASDLSHLTPAKPLHAYQAKDLPFALSGQTILNWDVGLGKTFGGIAAAIAHPGKSLIMVLKPVISKWAREIQTFFPGTQVVILGFRKNRKDRLVLNLKGLVDQARTCFFDSTTKIILTTHQVFARFRLNERDQREADIEDAMNLVGNSELRTDKNRRETLIQLAAERNFLFGGDLTFTDLPLASLLVIIDEGHQFKSLFPMPSSGWGNALVMAGNCGKSKRARDLKMKLDLVRNRGGKTLCLTATPVSNSVVEIFNMLRIFAPSVLKKRGIASPQHLIDTYCTMKLITTVSVSGTIVSGQTITGFRNVADLQAMWSEAMVTRTAAEVGLPLPAVREHVIRIKPTLELANFIAEQKDLLGKRIEQDHGSRKTSIFEIIAKLDKVAMYPPMLGLKSNPKGDRLVQNVASIYRQDRGGQIIFSDQLQSQYGLREMLIAAGIDENHIAILNASTAPKIDDRLAVQDNFNSGLTRVVIGGDIAAEGIDLQKNAVAIHFNNLNWHGQAIHQRKGRAVRQGNTQPFVDIYYYLLDGTTDIYRMATTQNKTHWWQHLRSSQTDVIEGNVFSDPISDDLVASLANNPEEVLKELTQIRRKEEIHREIRTFKKTIFQMGIALNPDNKNASLTILRTLEAKLSNLRWVNEAIIPEGIQRIHHIVALKSEHNNAGNMPWRERLGYNLSSYFANTSYMSLERLTDLKLDPNGKLFWNFDLAANLKDNFKTGWELRPRTFGKLPEPHPVTREQTEASTLPAQLLLPVVASAHDAPIIKLEVAKPQPCEIQLELFPNPISSSPVAVA